MHGGLTFDFPDADLYRWRGQLELAQAPPSKRVAYSLSEARGTRGPGRGMNELFDNELRRAREDR